MQELASILYEAYVEAAGGKSTVTGATLPPWGELSQETQDAWRAVAREAERTLSPQR